MPGRPCQAGPMGGAGGPGAAGGPDRVAHVSDRTGAFPAGRRGGMVRACPWERARPDSTVPTRPDLGPGVLCDEEAHQRSEPRRGRDGPGAGRDPSRPATAGGRDGPDPGRCRRGTRPPGGSHRRRWQRARAGPCGLHRSGDARRGGGGGCVHIAGTRCRLRRDPGRGGLARGPPDRQELHRRSAQLRPGRRARESRGDSGRYGGRGR